MRPALLIRASALCVLLAVTAGEAAPPSGALTADLYVQTSAEYRACCLTIYACAARQLESLLWSGSPPPARPAVVMDLDETVLDNATFQTYLFMHDLEYTPELWDRFEREGIEEAELVPGALEFIERAESLGVTVIFLSNRNERNLEATRATLVRLGINPDGLVERLYLKPDGGSSNKGPRRDAVSARYNVVMYFGDNLRDFSEVFEASELDEDTPVEEYLAAIERRQAAVDSSACHWGFDWFVLPNPMYGEWEELEGPDPARVLRPSGMKAP